MDPIFWFNVEVNFEDNLIIYIFNIGIYQGWLISKDLTEVMVYAFVVIIDLDI